MTRHRNVQLIEINDLNFSPVQSLSDESKREGYSFIERTITDWNSGANRFSAPGEKLWGLFVGPDIIGIGGLNQDPYAAIPNIGRVRHLYIQSRYRRNGYATALMLNIIDHARLHFVALRLFTDNQSASVFYETLGFKRTDDVKASHILNFQP